MGFVDINTLHDITSILPRESKAKIFMIDGAFYATVSIMDKNLVVAFRGEGIVEIYNTSDVEKVVNKEIEKSVSYDSHLYLNPERGFKLEVKKIA